VPTQKFSRIHSNFVRSGRPHRGIIVATQDDPRRNVRGLLRRGHEAGHNRLAVQTVDTHIVIVKQLPVLQCGACREYLIEEAVMERVDGMPERADTAAELEVVRYAA
jgi:hypothetical protein